MEILPPLINDLGLILVTAAVSVVLFKILRQPLVLGYIIAGYIAGPHVDLLPSVKEPHSIEVWADIGVIFLLFSLGLEFSFKKLMKAGGSASITGGFHVIFMLFAGFFTGKLLDWTTIDSIFLGAMLSMSSTMIILKALGEMNLMRKKFVSVTFGALIIEDIVAVLLLVLLTTIAVSQQFSGSALFFSFLKLAFFLIIWFLVGIFFVPTLLKRTKKYLNDEMLLIVSIGLCLLMVIMGYNAGFSPALGAFVMGSIISETVYSEKIVKLIEPVKDLFGAIFFVSVGMMIDPSAIVKYFGPVVIITLVAIVGKSISTSVGALLAGQPLRQSVEVGMSHVPIGEFSFIIATLGMSLGVISDFLYPIIVAVSALTIFVTPYLIMATEPTYKFLDYLMPEWLRQKMECYSSNALKVRTVSAWRVVFRANITHIVLMSVIIIAIISISLAFQGALDHFTSHGNLIIAGATLLLLLPFVWALAFRRIKIEEMQSLHSNRRFISPVSILLIFRILLSLFFLVLYIATEFNWETGMLVFFFLMVFFSVMAKRIQSWYKRFEQHFLKNYNSKENGIEEKESRHLAPWDGHMSEIKVPAESSLAGCKLENLQLRERFGISIALIKRGEISIYIPHRSEVIYPDDILFIIGSDEQMNQFSTFIEESLIATINYEERDLTVNSVELKSDRFVNRTLRESRIKEITEGLIVGLERNGERMLNPSMDTILKKGDIIWIVSEAKRIRRIADEN